VFPNVLLLLSATTLTPGQTLPSLAICTNAARSCCRVVDVWHQRMEDTRTAILLVRTTHSF
jgi:hypothetical protein